jgi:hypothetical protein
MHEPLDIRVIIKRKAPEFPRFIEIGSSQLGGWNLSGTTPVTISINGTEYGRRNLKPWGQGRDVWFLELTNEICDRAGIGTGDEVAMNVEMASTASPAELSSLIERDAEARRRWEQKTTGQQRMLGDHVRQAKQAKTRERRAVKALCSSQ